MCARKCVYSGGRYHISFVKPRKRRKTKIQSKGRQLRHNIVDNVRWPMQLKRRELGNNILIFISGKIIRFANILLPPPSNENNQLLSTMHSLVKLNRTVAAFGPANLSLSLSLSLSLGVSCHPVGRECGDCSYYIFFLPDFCFSPYF